MAIKPYRNESIKVAGDIGSKPSSNLITQALYNSSSRLPLLLIFVGILFSFYLQGQIPNDTFFSGDGGLKALLAEQLSAGKFRFDLDLPAIDWVRNLWEDGLYPFKPPFVYHLFDRYYITFPFTFPLVTAPFHALLGFRGFYVVPLVATWFLWFSFYSLCKRLKLGSTLTTLALAVLIFASPLTLYSAMYWEHTLAVALAFQGLSAVLFPPTQGLSKKRVLVGGALIGLSAWFRPEFLCLIGILSALVLVTKLKPFKQFDLVPTNTVLFFISLFSTTALFFILNALIYHHPAGIHAIQVLEKFTLRERLSVALNNLKDLNFDLFYYFPILAFSVVGVVLSLFSNKVQISPKMKMVLLLGFLFLIAVPLIVPAGAGGKQWGPRFLLILIPLATIVAISQLQFILRTNQLSLRMACISLFVAFFTAGVYINTYSGAVFLNNNYQAIPQALNALRSQPNSIIAVSHQFVAQALSPIVREKIFFLVEDSQDVEKLGMELLNQGYKEFLFLCYPYRPCKFPQNVTQNPKKFSKDHKFDLKIVSLDKFGIYPTYQVSIINSQNHN